jgi:hypothetical protein
VFERRPQGGASFGLFPPQFSGKIVGLADSLDLLVLLHQGKRTVTHQCQAASRHPRRFISEMCIASVYLSHRYFFGLTQKSNQKKSRLYSNPDFKASIAA